MHGLKQWKNWRTVLVGFVLGYIAAWGMHNATTLYDREKCPRHIHIPVLTP